MFKRLYPVKDAVVTNFQRHGIPAVGSNAGASEVSPLFKIASPSSLSHILVQFDLSAAPAISGSYEAILHKSDAVHDQTLPYGYSIVVRPLEQDWLEGRGFDIDDFQELGVTNWLSATNTQNWATPGAYPSGTLSASMFFDSGHEDLHVDVKGLLPSASLGFFIALDPVYEGDAHDYFVKKFHTRNTHFEDKKPFLEYRWDSSTSVPTASLSGAVDPTGSIDVQIYDLRPVYSSIELITLHLQVRPHDWNPAVVVTASSDASNHALTNCYYRLVDDVTDEVVVPFGTGTVKYTKLSFNEAGNFFDIDMGSLPTGSSIRIELLAQISSNWILIDGENFKFRVR